MAEGQDQDQKTEEPTGKRLADARNEGQVPLSQEVRTWFMLCGGLVVVMMVAPYLGGQMKESLVVYLAGADQYSPTDGSIRRALWDTVRHLAGPAAFLAAIMIIAALAGTITQTGLFASSKLLEPKWDRVSPLGGWKRLFSTQSLMEFLKGTLKICIVGAVVFIVVRPLFAGAELLNGMEAALQVKVIYQYTLKIMITVISVFTVIAFGDLVYQRFKYYRNMRMTKQEVKEEYKQTEGDPMAKARLRAVRMERARRRMMAAVPDADVVVTNPTHFAVALKYELGKMRAPQVVAKGQDMIALKIREIATENEVPIVENPPLARALYAACDIDEEVPVDQYKAVAEIISYVFKMKKRFTMQ